MGSLFTLYQRSKTYDVSDGTATISVAIKPMTWSQTIDIADARERINRDAKDQYDTDERRAAAKKQHAGRDPDALITDIINLERPTTASVADLSPNGDTPEGRTAAMDKWVERRRDTLKALPLEGLIDILVDREIRQLVSVHANNDYMDLCLVRMVIDPDTEQPLLSDKPGSPTYVRDLQTKTRVELARHWMAYMSSISEPAVRAEADAGPFVSPGASPKPSDDSHGVGTENSSTSPVTS